MSEQQSRVDIAVVILTYNEEENLAYALESVCGWAREVFVFDSFSTDKTLEVARGFDCVIEQHTFTDYGAQRRAALDTLPIAAEWIYFLDADEWLPSEAKTEIADVIASHPEENGFFCAPVFMWMGKWIRRGYYPTWYMRFFRRGKGHVESRGVGEHVIVEGKTGYLKHGHIHEDHKPLSRWIEKHNRYATMEANELLKEHEAEGELPASPFGTQAERKRWIRNRVWKRMPPLTRPVVYFGYRYVLRGGFLDGKEAFTYHFMQALWFQMLIDAKYLELTRTGRC